MKSWSPVSFWTVISVTVLAVAGFFVYVAVVGTDKAIAASGILVAGLTIVVIGATVLLAIKRESAHGKEPEESAIRTRQSLRGGDNSINIQAGRDLDLGDNNKLGR